MYHTRKFHVAWRYGRVSFIRSLTFKNQNISDGGRGYLKPSLSTWRLRARPCSLPTWRTWANLPAVHAKAASGKRSLAAYRSKNSGKGCRSGSFRAWGIAQFTAMCGRRDMQWLYEQEVFHTDPPQHAEGSEKFGQPRDLDTGHAVGEHHAFCETVH